MGLSLGGCERVRLLGPPLPTHSNISDTGSSSSYDFSQFYVQEFEFLICVTVAQLPFRDLYPGRKGSADKWAAQPGGQCRQAAIKDVWGEERSLGQEIFSTKPDLQMKDNRGSTEHKARYFTRSGLVDSRSWEASHELF